MTFDGKIYRIYLQANANFGPGLYEMESCLVTQGDKETEKPEWRTAGTMAEGRSFLGSAAVDGKVITPPLIYRNLYYQPGMVIGTLYLVLLPLRIVFSK